jgi:hypothetical protein
MRRQTAVALGALSVARQPSTQAQPARMPSSHAVRSKSEDDISTTKVWLAAIEGKAEVFPPNITNITVGKGVGSR